MTAYINLSEKHGHRDDHGFACGAEFNVKIRRRIDIPDFVREQLSESEIDGVWWEEAGQVRDSLKDTLQRRYKWIGELAFVGRGPGWLAIEDTECNRLTEKLAFKGKSRNWDTIGKVVDQHLKNFIKSMESPRFWRDVKGVTPEESPARQHSTKKSPTQLQREIDEALAKPGRRAHATKKPHILTEEGRLADLQLQGFMKRGPMRTWIVAVEAPSGDPSEATYVEVQGKTEAAALRAAQARKPGRKLTVRYAK